MSNPNAEDKIPALRRELARRRSECLELAPEDAMAQILEHPQPAALVHSFPEEDFHLLLQEIGPDDARPLIALASSRQLEYVLDQQVWERDRIDLKSLSLWLARFVQSEPARMVRWLTTEKPDLVEFYLFKSIEVRMRVHDQDPGDFGDGFFSLDNVFYVRIRDFPTAEPPGEAFQKQHHRLVYRILERLAEDDYVHYQSVLLAAVHVIPAETEEEAYRQRSFRLAEKGFLPFEEAVGLYQPLGFDRFHQTAARFRPLPETGDTRLPMVPLTLLDRDHLFSRTLQTMAPGEALDQIQSEFVSLCNRITVADRLKMTSRDDLRAVVHKACGYLNIGLERLEADPPSAAGTARGVQAFTLDGLFRLGYSEAVGLKQAAERWVGASWFGRNGLPLSFWGETWLGVVGGLLLKRPLFFDNYQSGRLYREFTSLADVQGAGRQLAQAQAFDRLLEQMRLDLPPWRRYGHLTYKSVLLTLWARRTLGLTDTLKPIPLDAFAPFWESLFSTAAPKGASGRTIGDDRKSDLLLWLAQRTDRNPADLSNEIGLSLGSLFDELQEEYGRVSIEKIDPRYISHFLLGRTKTKQTKE